MRSIIIYISSQSSSFFRGFSKISKLNISGSTVYKTSILAHTLQRI